MNAWMKKGLTALGAAALLTMASEGMLLHARPDIATGRPNICFGDTHNVKLGQTATPEECQARLQAQLAAAEATVRSCIPPPPAPEIKAALIEFTYNEGGGKKGVKSGLCVLKNGRPSTIRVRAQAGDWAGVCEGFLAWVYGGGTYYRGLDIRRHHERDLCMQGVDSLP